MKNINIVQVEKTDLRYFRM